MGNIDLIKSTNLKRLFFRHFIFALCTLFMFLYFMLFYNKSDMEKKSSKLKNFVDKSRIMSTESSVVRRPRYAAILTVTQSKRYLFSVPFTAAAWQRINVEPIVIMVGEYGTFKRHHQANITINLLEEMGVKVHYIVNLTTTAATLSQVSRLFATAMPFSKEYSPDDIFITGDADMMPFHLKNHIPNVFADQKAYFYNADCTGPTRVPPARGSYSVHMFPMSTIAATVSSWREIMGLTNSPHFGGKEIEDYLKVEFGPDYFHPSDSKSNRFVGSQIWFADQSLISYKVAEWFKADPANRAATTLTRGGCAPRIDRIKWPAPLYMQKQSLNELGDAHLLENGYSDDQWRLFTPLIRLVFNGSRFDILRTRLYKYRQDYILLD